MVGKWFLIIMLLNAIQISGENKKERTNQNQRFRNGYSFKYLFDQEEAGNHNTTVASLNMIF